MLVVIWANKSVIYQPSARRRDPLRAGDEGLGMSATCWHRTPPTPFVPQDAVHCPADGILEPVKAINAMKEFIDVTWKLAKLYVRIDGRKQVIINYGQIKTRQHAPHESFFIVISGQNGRNEKRRKDFINLIFTLRPQPPRLH